MQGCIGDPSWWNNIPSEFVINRNYHCIWQSHSGMRFVLKEVKNNKAFMITKGTGKSFWTNLLDLRDTTRKVIDDKYEKRFIERANKFKEKQCQ